MKRRNASQNPTLLEIADVLGIQGDTILQWIIEGKLLVARHGARTVMVVDKNQSLRASNSGEILILTKSRLNQKWQAYSC